MKMSDVLRQLRQQHSTADARPRLLDRYAAFLPLTDATPRISLGEGYTPLIHARRLGRAMGAPLLHVKFEGANPTGSFKDRGMVMAVAKAIEDGATTLMCASTGNTAASAAAYAAASGLECVVVLPAGQIALGKLLAAQFAGAKVVAVEGGFDDALDVVRRLTEGGEAGRSVTLVNSGQSVSSPGPKDGGVRGVRGPGRERLTTWPYRSAMPATSRRIGWASPSYEQAGMVDTRPVMLGFQAEGAAPLVFGRPFENPKTVATAIKIGRPASGELALKARDESRGTIEAVTDDEILAAYRDLARYEGIFVEPASAASVAGVRKLAAQGRIDPGATIVCVLTGHGLKDPETASRNVDQLITAPATVEGVREALAW
jgi:threonine synthase